MDADTEDVGAIADGVGDVVTIEEVFADGLDTGARRAAGDGFGIVSVDAAGWVAIAHHAGHTVAGLTVVTRQTAADCGGVGRGIVKIGINDGACHGVYSCIKDFMIRSI